MKLRPEMEVGFDAGTSTSKILYQVDGGRIQYMTMGPECLNLPASSKKYLPKEKGMGLAEDNAWIEREGEIVAIGRMAKEYRGTASIKPLKAKIAVPKVLATVGAIAEKEELSTEIDLKLSILLPYSEIRSKEQLSEDLEEALEEFEFCGKPLEVKLNECNIMLEGSGIAMLHNFKHGKEFKQTNQVYLMLGHRNTSLLVFERGSFSTVYSSTTNHGFYNCIDKFREKVPGVTREDVLQAMIGTVEIEYDWHKSFYSFDSKRINVDFSGVTNWVNQLETNEVKSAFTASLEEYWMLIANWLNESLPPIKAIDGFWVCGGATSFLMPYLEKKLHPLKIKRLEKESSEMWKALGFNQDDYPREFIEQNLVERMMDVWGLFAVFSDYFDKMGVRV